MTPRDVSHNIHSAQRQDEEMNLKEFKQTLDMRIVLKALS